MCGLALGNLVNKYWELHKNREPFQMSLREGDMSVDLQWVVCF